MDRQDPLGGPKLTRKGPMKISIFFGVFHILSDPESLSEKVKALSAFK